jgi:hypothetical protein
MPTIKFSQQINHSPVGSTLDFELAEEDIWLEVEQSFVDYILRLVI